MVVENERAAGFEVLVETTQRLGVAFAVAPKPEAAADKDSSVGARRVELVHRLHEERRRKRFTLGFLVAERDHVRRDIAAVDVESGSEVPDEQTAGAAGNVESRLTFLDVLLKLRDLGAIFVELGPLPRNEAVVPGLWRVRHVSGPPLSIRRCEQKAEQQRRACRRGAAADRGAAAYLFCDRIGRTKIVVVQSWNGSVAPALMTWNFPAASAAAI